jgi:hypothetical protein
MSIPEYPSRTPADPNLDLVPRPRAGQAGLPEDPFAAQPLDGGLPDDLSAAAREQRAQRRTRTRVRRGFGWLLRRRRLSHGRAVAALLAEHDHIGGDRDQALPTHGETTIQAVGKSGADAVLAKSRRRLEREARDADALRAKQAELTIRAAHRPGVRVRHPDGGERPAAEVQRDEAAARRRIEDETARGSRKHHRLPWWIGHIPILVLVVDFCLLLYFFSGITNVDWQSPLSASLVFAVLLAGMVTVLSYGFLAFTGHRLRGYKDHSGAVSLADADGLTKAACWASALGIAVLATLMFIRMRTEVLDALGPHGGDTALVLALTLAVIGALANFLVVAVHALDGSHEVARLNALSAAISGPLGQAREMQERADLIPHRIAVQRRRAHRMAIDAITQAGRPMCAADQAISAAQAAHQATGPHGSPPSDPNQHEHVGGYRDPQSVPRPDLRAVHATLGHIDTDLAPGPD